jgi:hypothetical protein
VGHKQSCHSVLFAQKVVTQPEDQKTNYEVDAALSPLAPAVLWNQYVLSQGWEDHRIPISLQGRSMQYGSVSSSSCCKTDMLVHRAGPGARLQLADRNCIQARGTGVEMAVGIPYMQACQPWGPADFGQPYCCSSPACGVCRLAVHRCCLHDFFMALVTAQFCGMRSFLRLRPSVAKQNSQSRQPWL